MLNLKDEVKLGTLEYNYYNCQQKVVVEDI